MDAEQFSKKKLIRPWLADHVEKGTQEESVISSQLTNENMLVPKYSNVSASKRLRSEAHREASQPMRCLRLVHPAAQDQMAWATWQVQHQYFRLPSGAAGF